MAEWTVDGRDLVASSHQYLAAAISGYVRDDSSPLSQMISTGAVTAQEVLDFLGADVLPNVESQLLVNDGIGRRAATSARGTLTVNSDAVGPHTLAGGEYVSAGGVDWYLADDLDVGSGLSTGTQTVIAVEPGSAPNTITTAAATTATSYAWIDTAEVALTLAGTDEETVDEHLERGRKLKRLYGPQLILPQDFADYCEAAVDGVARACVYDGYDPTGPSTGNERMVSLSLIDADGAWVGSTIATAAETAVEAKRESSFVVHFVQPTFTTVNVAFTFTVVPGAVAADVKDAAETAVESYLSPANYAGPRNSDDPLWRRVDKVYWREVEAVIQSVEGVDRITACTLNGSATTDVTLSGAFPLPEAGTVVGTAA